MDEPVLRELTRGRALRSPRAATEWRFLRRDDRLAPAVRQFAWTECRASARSCAAWLRAVRAVRPSTGRRERSPDVTSVRIAVVDSRPRWSPSSDLLSRETTVQVDIGQRVPTRARTNLRDDAPCELRQPSNRVARVTIIGCSAGWPLALSFWRRRRRVTSRTLPLRVAVRARYRPTSTRPPERTNWRRRPRVLGRSSMCRIRARPVW